LGLGEGVEPAAGQQLGPQGLVEAFDLAGGGRAADSGAQMVMPRSRHTLRALARSISPARPRSRRRPAAQQRLPVGPARLRGGIGPGKNTGSAFFYPNFARYFARRSEPAVRALLGDPSARAALFPDDDQDLADVLRVLDEQAQQEGWRFLGGWGSRIP
jgi:hypothetical protein